MKIIIEIESGMVSGVFYKGRGPRPEVLVVDLDPGKVGEETVAEQAQLEPLADASDITREAVER